MTGSALKLGGLAAIGGLAYKAYQNYQNGKQPARRAAGRSPNCCRRRADTDFNPAQAPQGEAEFTLALVRAMIAAAKADGHIDDGENAEDRRPPQRCRASARRPRHSCCDELEKPLDLDALCRLGQDRGAAGRALHRLAAGDRPEFARRARLSRPARRPAAASRMRWSTMSRRRFRPPRSRACRTAGSARRPPCRRSRVPAARAGSRPAQVLVEPACLLQPLSFR